MKYRCVIDTNVVLDWLVFDDPGAQWLRDTSREGCEILTHTTLIEELSRVLAYPDLKLTGDRRAELLQRYAERTVQSEMPEAFSRDCLLLPAGFPHCADRDDDVFLAVVYHARADALVTKDKALLKLRKRAARYGVRILTVGEASTMLVQARNRENA